MLFTNMLQFLYTIFNSLYSAVTPIIEFMTYKIVFLSDFAGYDITVGGVLFGAGFIVYATWTFINWIIPLQS